MKTILVIAGSLAVVHVLPGCSSTARSPEAYRGATRAVLETKNDEIRACYWAVLATMPGVAGKVTVTFDVETKQGKIVNVAIDAPNTTAPLPVAECVKRSIAGLAISPPDSRTGQASFVYEFTPPPDAPKG